MEAIMADNYKVDSGNIPNGDLVHSLSVDGVHDGINGGVPASDKNERIKASRRRDGKWRPHLFPSAPLSEYKDSFKQLIILSWPVALYMVSGPLIGTTSIVFSGHIGKDEIVASSLAQSIIHVAWRSVMIGFTSGADTLFSQTYGSKNKKRVGIFFQRFVVLTMLLAVLCGGVLINTEGILLLIGQDQEIARLAKPYAAIYILATPADAVVMITIKYLESQSIVRPLVAIILLMSGLNILLHFILVSALGYGMIGAVSAQTVSYYLGLLMLLGYIYCTKLHKETWPGWSWECLQEWGTVMKLALPGTGVVCLEWWSFEVGFFIAGALGKVEVGAHAVVLNSINIVWNISAGIGVGASIMIGNNLGANKPNKAQLTSACSIILGAIFGVLYIVLFLSLQNVLGYIFTSEVDVVELAASLIPIVSVFTLFDSMNSISFGILRGCGYQYVGAIAGFCGFDLVGIPLGVILTFVLDYGLKGIWLGLMTGLILEPTFLMIFISYINWTKEAVKAQKRAAVLGDSDKKMPLQSDDETPLELTTVHDRGTLDDTMQKVEDSTDKRSLGCAVDSKQVSNSEDVKTEEGCLDRSISADEEEKESEPVQSDHGNCVGEGREADGEAGSSPDDIHVNALQARDSSTAERKEADDRHEDKQDETVYVIEILTLDKLSLNQLILRRGLALFLCVSFFIASTLISVYIVPSLRPATSPNYANTTANYTTNDLTENYQ